MESIVAILSWSFAAVGLVVVAWALFWDRSRGRRRCPKCWYDMSGTPEIDRKCRTVAVCPECGMSANRGSMLLRTRRRWRWAAASLLVIPLIYIVSVRARIQREGASGLIPTTCLIGAVPHMDLLEPGWTVWNVKSPVRTGWKAWFFQLLDGRLKKPDFGSWSRRLMMWHFTQDLGRRKFGSVAWCEVEGTLLQDAAQETDPVFFQRVRSLAGLRVVTRERWPSGVPVYGVVQPWSQVRWYRDGWRWRCSSTSTGFREFSGSERFMLGCGSMNDGSPWADGLVMLGSNEKPGIVSYTGKLEFQDDHSSKWHAAGSGIASGHINIVPAAGLSYPALAVITPVRDKGIEDALKSGESFVLVPGTRVPLRFNADRLKNELERSKLTFAVQVQLLCDGSPIGESRAWWKALVLPGATLIDPIENGLVLTREKDKPFPVITDHAWTARIRSDPELALRDLESDRFWDGDVTVPVRVIQNNRDSTSSLEVTNE